MNDHQSVLFEPIELGPLNSRNRIAMPAVHMGMAVNGIPSQELIEFYSQRAQGGAGIITVGVCDTLGVGTGLVGALSLSRDEHTLGMDKLCKQIKKGGAVAGAQLCPLVGYNNPSYALTVEEIDSITMSVGDAAGRAADAGFDFVEVLLSGGSVLSHLLSSALNENVPEGYKETLEARLKAPLQAIKCALEATKGELPVCVRIHCHELMERGYDQEGARLHAKAFERAGVFAVNITGAGHRTRVPQLTPQAPPGVLAPFARTIADAISVPTFFGGRIRTSLEAAHSLAVSGAKAVTLCRALLKDPLWPAKVKEGREDEVNHCLVCGHCLDAALSKKKVVCSSSHLPTSSGPRAAANTPGNDGPYLVAGAGPCGLTAALEFHRRNKRVILFERQPFVGGKWKSLLKLVGRRHLQLPLQSLIRAVERAGIEVRTATELTPKIAADLAPEGILLAIGAKPVLPTIPGIEEHPNLIHGDNLLRNDRAVVGDVAIIGGGGSAVELALHLACAQEKPSELTKYLARYANHLGLGEPETIVPKRSVTILKRKGFVGKGLARSSRWTELIDLSLWGVGIYDRTDYKKITPEGVEIFDRREKRGLLIPADTIIAATGYRPEHTEKVFDGVAPKIIAAGDFAKVGNIGAAIAGAREAVEELLRA